MRAATERTSFSRVTFAVAASMLSMRLVASASAPPFRWRRVRIRYRGCRRSLWPPLAVQLPKQLLRIVWPVHFCARLRFAALFVALEASFSLSVRSYRPAVPHLLRSNAASRRRASSFFIEILLAQEAVAKNIGLNGLEYRQCR
jgi:hypothetical protein